MYVRNSDDSPWWGDGPPGGVLGPADRVIEVVYINPDGSEATPEELAAACEACRP